MRKSFLIQGKNIRMES